MRRRTRHLVLAVAAAAALAGAVGLQLRHERTALPGPLTALDAAGITEVTVRCRGCDTRRFERVDGRWWMREPYDLPADPAAVDGLLAIAATPVRTWYHEGDLDLSRLGLDPPLIELQLDAHAIRVGTTDAIDSDRYIAVGNTVARARDRFSPRLLAVAETELERHLVPRDHTALTVSLSVAGAVHAGDAGAWAQAQALHIQKPAEGFQPPASAIEATLVLAGGTPLSYRLLRQGNAYLALRDAPALIYVLDQATLVALLPEGVALPQ